MGHVLTVVWRSSQPVPVWIFAAMAAVIIPVWLAMVIWFFRQLRPAVKLLSGLPALTAPNDPGRLEKLHSLIRSAAQNQGVDVTAFDQQWNGWIGQTSQYAGVIDRRSLSGRPVQCEAYLTQAGDERHLVLWIHRGAGKLGAYLFMVFDQRALEQLRSILGSGEDDFLGQVQSWDPAISAVISQQGQPPHADIGISMGPSGHLLLSSFKVIKDFGAIEERQLPLSLSKGGQQTTWIQGSAAVGLKNNEIILVLEYRESMGGPVHQGAISVGPIKGQFEAQATRAETNWAQYPFGQAGREALRRILGSQMDSAAAA